MRQCLALLVLLSAVCFGTTGTAQALGPDAAPVTVGAVRIAVGGLLLLAVARAVPAAAAAWPRRELGAIALAIAVYQLAFFAAVDRTGVAVGTVVALGSAPAIAGVTGRLIDGQPLTGRWAGATALACAGVLLLVLGGGGASVDPLGIMLAVVSGTGYATYAVLAKRLLRLGHAPERVMAASFSLGAVLLAPVLVLGDVSLAGHRRRARARAVPRRDPDRARLRAVRARPAPPDARARPRRSRSPSRSPPPASACSRWASAPARSRRPAPALVLAGLLVLAAAGPGPAAARPARGGRRRERRGLASSASRRSTRSRRRCARGSSTATWARGSGCASSSWPRPTASRATRCARRCARSRPRG